MKLNISKQTNTYSEKLKEDFTMGLSLEEQEVNIGFGRTEDMCTLYASDSTWVTKMENLCRRTQNNSRGQDRPRMAIHTSFLRS